MNALMPKSVILACPSWLSRMLAGLMSRCTCAGGGGGGGDGVCVCVCVCEKQHPSQGSVMWSMGEMGWES
jgi:hypothetical protein